MKYKVFLFAFAMVFLIGILGIGSALTAKINVPMNVTQGCANSSYSNISQITLNERLLSSNQIAMTSTGGGSYTYPYTPTTLGRLCFLTHCDEYGVDIQAPFCYDVTPSGNSDSGSNLTLFVIIVLLIYTITFVGFFGKHEWTTILGGMGMIALGLYTINNGVIIYKDFITNVFSWTTIGLGALFSLIAAIAVIDENS